MIALGSDHAGFELKEIIKRELELKDIACKDFGTFGSESADYPDIALKVCRAIKAGDCGRGILVCGTGIGISIAANKVRGIRAAVCSDTFSAKYTRLHNDANILCLGGRVTGAGLALEILDIFLNTPYEGGRHGRRLDKITELENNF